MIVMCSKETLKLDSTNTWSQIIQPEAVSKKFTVNPRGLQGLLTEYFFRATLVSDRLSCLDGSWIFEMWNMMYYFWFVTKVLFVSFESQLFVYFK